MMGEDEKMMDILQSFVDLGNAHIYKYPELIDDIEATKWAIKRIEELEGKHKADEICVNANVEYIEKLLKKIKDLQELFDTVDHECSRLEKIDIEKDKKIQKLEEDNKRLDTENQRLFETLMQVEAERRKTGEKNDSI